MANGSKKTISNLKSIFRSIQDGCSITGACRKVGIEYMTLYLWMQKDPRLKEKIHALADSRVEVVEDTCYSRLIGERASPVEYIFYLKNRNPKRWNNDQRPTQETLQIVLNKVLFIITDTVKDESVRKEIAHKLYELGKDNTIFGVKAATSTTVVSKADVVKEVREIGNDGGVPDDFTEAAITGIEVTDNNGKKVEQGGTGGKTG
jgi:hypothetical protein